MILLVLLMLSGSAELYARQDALAAGGGPDSWESVARDATQDLWDCEQARDTEHVARIECETRSANLVRVDDRWFEVDAAAEIRDLRWSLFQACAAGPAIPARPGCLPVDLDQDGDVDMDDFGLLQCEAPTSPAR